MNYGDWRMRLWYRVVSPDLGNASIMTQRLRPTAHYVISYDSWNNTSNSTPKARKPESQAQAQASKNCLYAIPTSPYNYNSTPKCAAYLHVTSMWSHELMFSVDLTDWFHEAIQMFRNSSRPRWSWLRRTFPTLKLQATFNWWISVRHRGPDWSK